MARCEYDPEHGQAAIGSKGCPNQATLRVGANGQWHLCKSCAALPQFNRFRSRAALRVYEEAPKETVAPHPHGWVPSALTPSVRSDDKD